MYLKAFCIMVNLLFLTVPNSFFSLLVKVPVLLCLEIHPSVTGYSSGRILKVTFPLRAKIWEQDHARKSLYF